MYEILSNPELWMALITIISGAIAIWQNQGKRTSQKIIDSVVLGVDEFSKLDVGEKEAKKLKASIKQKALEYGVEKILNKAVKGLTISSTKN